MRKTLLLGLVVLGLLWSRAFAEDAVFSPGFGIDGKGFTLIADYTAEGYAARVVPLPGGGFFVAGGGQSGSYNNSNNFAQIAILKEDGTVNSAAVNGGLIRTTLLDASYSLAGDGNGGFLVGGGTGSNNSALGLVRFFANGAVDTTFGTGGAAGTKFGIGHDTTDGLAVQGNGAIMAVGTANNGVPNDQGDLVMARFTSQGQLDLSFNGTRKRVENFFVPGTLTDADFAKAAAVQPDGKILVGGTGANILVQGGTFQGGFHLLRYNADGSRDNSFGQGGLVTTTFGITNGTAYITHLQLLSDGRIFALGHETHSRLLMAIYNPDGTPDSSFGQNGAVVVERFANYNANAFFQNNGSIRVVGASDHIFDLLFDSHGQLIHQDTLSLPTLGPTIFGQEYYDAIVLDDGDILAVGRAAGWMLVSRFDRPILHAPEPSSLLLLGASLFFVSRRMSRLRP